MSSGGSRGAYEVGVLKALCEGKSPSTGYKPLAPDIFKGSSIGAFNSAFMVSEMCKTDCLTAIDRLRQIWTEKLADPPGPQGNGAYRYRANPLEFLDPRSYVSNLPSTLKHLLGDGLFLTREAIDRVSDALKHPKEPLPSKIVRLVDLSAFISNEPYLELIESTIDFARVRTADIDLVISATNWDKGTLRHFDNRDMTDEGGALIVQASGALPGFFPPVKIDGSDYVDAGVLGYAHVGPAIAQGAFDLHRIFVDASAEHAEYHSSQSTMETMYRIFSTIWVDRVRSTRADHWNTFKQHLQRLIAKGAMSEEDANEMFFDLMKKGQDQDPHEYDSLNEMITLHNYWPQDKRTLHTAILDLRLDTVLELFEAGYQDAIKHNCEANHCIVPD